MKSVKDKGSITWIIIDVKGVQQWQRKISNRVDDKGKLVTGLMTMKISNRVDDKGKPVMGLMTREN